MFWPGTVYVCLGPVAKKKSSDDYSKNKLWKVSLLTMWQMHAKFKRLVNNYSRSNTSGIESELSKGSVSNKRML